MAVVSSDHADPSLCAEDLGSAAASSRGGGKPGPRLISAEEVEQHSGGSSGEFWCVVDGFVVDATEFVDAHPGGLRKLLSTNSAEAGERRVGLPVSRVQRSAGRVCRRAVAFEL